MGLLDRLRGGHGESSRHVEAEATTQPVCLLGGQDDLEVVGELASGCSVGSVWGDRRRPDPPPHCGCAGSRADEPV